jgi:hypothetical protein
MKIIGFKMMLGEWANELDPNDLLEMYATKIGIGNVKGDERLKSNCEDELPNNKMTNYEPKTTIMTFMFNKGYNENELPEYFTKGSNGIIMGESNCELIYEDER